MDHGGSREGVCSLQASLSNSLPSLLFSTAQCPSVPILFNSVKLLQLNVFVFVARTSFCILSVSFYRIRHTRMFVRLHLSYNYNKMYIGFDIKRREDVDNVIQKVITPVKGNREYNLFTICYFFCTAGNNFFLFFIFFLSF